MNQSTYDPYLLYSNEPYGIVGLQTDDTLFIGDTAFAENKEVQLHKAGFLAKARDQLTNDKSLKFNRGLIELKDDSIYLTQ